MDKKFLVSAHEVALYEIWADSKDEAKEAFEGGEGDFIGYDTSQETILEVEEFENAGTR